MIEILKSKIHRATITDANVDYEGSITISEELMLRANILEYEKVLVADIANGARFETYVIKTEAPNTICVNGAAAKLVNIKDKIIIMSYQYVNQVEAGYKPVVVLVDDKNNIIEESK